MYAGYVVSCVAFAGPRSYSFSSAALTPFPQHQEKMVLVPRAKHHFAPLLVEGHRAVPIPIVRSQPKVKLSRSEHWTSVVPSLHPKPRSIAIQLGKAEHQATVISLPHLNQPAMSVTPQCPKPRPRTIILRLPYPAYKPRTTAVPLSCPQYQVGSLRVDLPNQEPPVNNAHSKAHTDSKMAQGCGHVPERPAYHHVSPVSPPCPVFQGEAPPYSNHKFKIAAIPILIPNYQVKVPEVSLVYQNQPPDMSSSPKSRDKQATSQGVCGKPQRQPHRSRTTSSRSHQQATKVPSSPRTEKTGDTAVPTHQGPSQPQARAKDTPLIGHKQKSRNRIMEPSEHDQQARAMAVSSPMAEAISTCPDLPAEIPKCPPLKIHGTSNLLPPSAPEATTPEVSSEVPAVSKQSHTISPGPDPPDEVLSKLIDCIVAEQDHSQQEPEALLDVEDQDVSFLDSEDHDTILSGGEHQCTASENHHLTDILLRPNNCAGDQLWFQQQSKASQNPRERVKIMPTFNCEMRLPPLPKPRTMLSLNFDDFIEGKPDFDHQTSDEISSYHQTNILPISEQITENEDIEAQDSICLDWFSKSSSESNYQVTLPLGPDEKIKVPLHPDCQVLSLPEPHHRTESEITNDDQTEVLSESNYQTKDALDGTCFSASVHDLDDGTESLLDFHHQGLAASDASDKAALDDLQNTSPQSQPSHQTKVESGLDQCCEPDLGLDERDESLLNSSDHVKAAPECDDEQAGTTLDVIPKSTTELSPEHQADDAPDPEDEKEDAMLPSYQDPTLSGPDHQFKEPPGPSYLPELSPKSKDQVESISTYLTSPDQKFEITEIQEKDSGDILGPGTMATLKSGPENLIKFPLEAKNLTNLHQESLDRLSPHPEFSKTVFNPPPKDQAKKNADPWFFKYFKPYSTETGNISNKVVNSIINSIPQEKIKIDVQKQILLRQMKKCPKTQRGPRLSCTYPICLICASWIPHGCIHTNSTKDHCGAQLVAIPIPVPGSNQEMGIKFVLQVSQKKPSPIKCFPNHYNLPYHSPYHPPALSLLQPVPPRLPAFQSLYETMFQSRQNNDFQPYKKTKFVNQMPFERKIPFKSNNIIDVRPKTPPGVFRTLLEKFQNKRMH
uniref:Uncharacterized LOC103100453 n=1 Tax=Monodelphis domestica TaxID=13616 RepID=K7E2L6_MONDO